MTEFQDSENSFGVIPPVSVLFPAAGIREGKDPANDTKTDVHGTRATGKRI